MPDIEPDPDRQLTVVPAAETPRIPRASAASIVVPAIVAYAGDAAAKRFLEFFAVTIRNRNTRTAYLHAAGRFFASCDPITTSVPWTRSSRYTWPPTSRPWEMSSKNRR